MNLKPTLIAAALALALTACSPANDAAAPAANEYGDGAAPAAEPAAAEAAGGIALAAQARVVLQEVQGSGVSGELVFNPDGDALRLTGEVRGLPAGSTHGFHVHETGDCSAPDATSAGGHFNPMGAPHGDSQAEVPHHAGDMPNLVAGDDGVAQADKRLPGLRIGDGSELDVVGRALIVHAQADDYATQPTGNAGARIACGVIELATPAPEAEGPAQ
ncbi:superoxide dismutase family protein [Arenimonas caeni]|jgi:Cu-Zn family superoxide dismutase|uniref:Superoxide dismutase [Cu-Zn] n=1 Tax=Arenimonas caeni TaxID=2058085 RepID=A0A2P6M929_9GAMM|nr:superoxide dismutase family protein [Arenimonas caeni]MDY0021855.1 superoxide dismutase family protein [Arenimonas caeni]PRH82490.1 superoxide dismutase [Arenimonas caeni]